MILPLYDIPLSYSKDPKGGRTKVNRYIVLIVLMISERGSV